ncbi:NudC domain-containing protein 1 [Thelohanellus kitauei]|uniref:NudC domain-containing protein 1 n=1 Tax=Thelohanellus kitauei TaxID=669202 RepID=A0A0C2N8N3_THEKT|nr:NudC domain-containing protein 1 [Thelohanellus kitauei]
MIEKIGKVIINRDLLNPKFEEYKIRNDSVEMTQISLEKEVLEQYNTSNRSDYLSSKMNVFINSLSYNQGNFYYFSVDGELLQLKLIRDEFEAETVFKLNNKKRLFSPSIHFVGNQKLVSDGADTLILFDDSWKEIKRFQLDHIRTPKFIYSALMFENSFIVVFGSLKTIRKDDKDHMTCSVRICTINNETDEVVNREILANDFPVAFQVLTPEYGVAIMDSRFKDYLELPPEPVIEPYYTWSQDPESIDVQFDLDKLKTKYDADKVKILVDRITIDDKTFIFAGKIDAGSSRWTYDLNSVNFTIFKLNQGFWFDLFSNDYNGVHMISAEEEQFNEELVQGLNRYTASDNEYISSHLSTHYDEDLADRDEFVDYYCNLYNLKESAPSQEINLSTRKIMNVSFDEQSKIMKVNFQRDVDAIGVTISPTTDFQLDCKHQYTFHALAYVYLSKRDTRFTFVSEDAKFFYLIDSKGYVFIYECSGKMNKSTQMIAEIKEMPLGAVLIRHILYVLTKNSLIQIKIK